MGFSPLNQPSGKSGKPSGMAAAAASEFSVKDAMGGPRGLAEGVLPSFLFTVMFTVTRDLTLALMCALAVAGLAVLARLVSRTTIMPGIVGMLGVAFCAWYSRNTGDARDFFLPGLWINLGYGTVFLLSTFSLPWLRNLGPGKGPWPMLGIFLGPVTGEMMTWRTNPARARAFRLATYVWAGMFAARLAVQFPLYVADNVAMLGTARLIMSTPLFLVCGWVTYVLLQRAPIAPAESTPVPPEQRTE